MGSGVTSGDAGVGDVPFIKAEFDVEARVGSVLANEAHKGLPGLGSGKFDIEENAGRTVDHFIDVKAGIAINAAAIGIS